MKTSHSIYLFALLLCSFSSLAQTDLTDQERKLFEENKTIRYAEMQDNYIPGNATINNTPSAKSLMVDEDDDGMDDAWETSNELDPTDPKDAWGDNDSDHILNLFEYQLDTDPLDATSPAVIEVAPTEADDLDNFIESSEGGIMVIRLSEGVYETNALKFFDDGFRLMIQGGWNADFSDRNPDLFTTIWNGRNDEALYLSSSSVAGSDNSATILDGINFSADEYFYLNGVVAIFTKISDATISILDCSFSSNPHFGLGLFHWDNLETCIVYMVNSVIGNNLGGGINAQFTNPEQVRYRFFNTTINNPNSEDGGVNGIILSPGSLNLELTNCINKGNTEPALNMRTWADFKASLLNTNIDDSDPELDIVDLGGTINEAPLFQDPLNDDWSLAGGSPCIDTGIDVGLKYNDAAPDMGAIESGTSSIKALNFISDFNVFPNPFTDQVIVDLDEIIGQQAKIIFYDMSGNKVLDMEQQVKNKLAIDAAYLSSGIYQLQIITDQQHYQTKVLKF